jgi:acetolactate synthase-1/2/3 large subunit
MKISPDSAASLIARLLKQRGVKRVFALCGGHIMPIWMRLDAEGIRIIDVRDERAAVHWLRPPPGCPEIWASRW